MDSLPGLENESIKSTNIIFGRKKGVPKRNKNPKNILFWETLEE